jgi:hypothetical protein
MIEPKYLQYGGPESIERNYPRKLLENEISEPDNGRLFDFHCIS